MIDLYRFSVNSFLIYFLKPLPPVLNKALFITK